MGDNIQQLQLNAAGGNVELTQFTVSSNEGNATSSIQATNVNIDGDMNFKGSSTLNMETLNVENMTLENTVFQNSFNMYGSLTVNNIGAGGIFNDVLSFQSPEDNGGIAIQNITNSLNVFKYNPTIDGVVDINPKLLMKVDYDKESINITESLRIEGNIKTSINQTGFPKDTVLQKWEFVTDDGLERSMTLKSPETGDENAPFIFDTGNSILFRVDDLNGIRLHQNGAVAIGRYLTGANHALEVSGRNVGRQGYVGMLSYDRRSEWWWGWFYSVIRAHGDISAEHFIAYGSVHTYSDERIKSNIALVNDTHALDIIKKIESYTYEYIDQKRYSNQNDKKIIGFIAQQVAQHLPEAIKMVLEYIPNIMKILENIEWEQDNNKWKLRYPGIEFKENNTGKVLFYVCDDIDGQEDRLEIMVEDDKETFIFDKKWKKVCVYGTEVNDFHAIDKHKIFALYHSGIQELSRHNDNKTQQIQELKDEVNELKTENIELKQKLQIMENDLALIKQKLGM